MPVLMPKPSCVEGKGVSPVPPIEAISAAAGVFRFMISSGNIEAARGVEVGCEDTLIL